MWRAWEHLRLDAATGLSVWFRDHADHHMTILLDADGPFKGCDPTHSDRPLEPLPHDPPPPGTFEADDDFMPSAPPHAPVVATGYSPDVGRSLKIGRAPVSNRRARNHTAQQSDAELAVLRTHLPPRENPADCLRPVSPTGGRTATRSTAVSLSLARRLGSASGRRPAFRATSTTGSPQGGNQR